jgi:hypothetical protein
MWNYIHWGNNLHLYTSLKNFMAEIDLNNAYWDRLKGYFTELRVDARWILRDNDTKKPIGSLRIVSHPDLPPGQLRAFFTYVTEITPKTKSEKIQTIEDFQMDIAELEVYSISENIETGLNKIEKPFKELEELFGVKIFT